MKKTFLIFALIGLMVTGARANDDTVAIKSLKDYDPTVGIAYYHDISSQGLAAYVQLPIAKFSRYRVSFGYIQPLDEGVRGRGRLIFSLSTLWADDLGLPDWVGAETGVYGVSGPYQAWGLQLGLLNFKW